MATSVNLSVDGKLKRNDTEENILADALTAAVAANEPALTDGSTGSANDAIVEVTNTTSDVSGLINDNFADLTAKVNAILVALKSAGLMAADS